MVKLILKNNAILKEYTMNVMYSLFTRLVSELCIQILCKVTLELCCFDPLLKT